MNFYDWLQQRVGADTQVELARKTGAGQSSLSRWKNETGKAVDFDSCRAIAKHTGWPILDILIHAGLITADEAGVTVVVGPARDLTDDELGDAVRDRLAMYRRAVLSDDPKAAVWQALDDAAASGGRVEKGNDRRAGAAGE